MYECFDIDEPEPYHSLSIITIIVDKGSFLVTKFISKSGNVLGTRLIFTKIKKKQMSNLTCKPTLIKVKYTWGILQIYWKYISKVYLKCTSIILETYFKFTSSILQVYFNLLSYRRRRRRRRGSILQVFIISTKGIHLKHICEIKLAKLEIYFKYTWIIPKVYFLEVCYKYTLKLVSAIFYQIFIFHQMIAL